MRRICVVKIIGWNIIRKLRVVRFHLRSWLLLQKCLVVVSGHCYLKINSLVIIFTYLIIRGEIIFTALVHGTKLNIKYRDFYVGLFMFI